MFISLHILSIAQYEEPNENQQNPRHLKPGKRLKMMHGQVNKLESGIGSSLISE